MDRLDGEPVGVLQQAGDVPDALGHVAADDAVAVARLVVHVDDGERESLVELRAQEQPAVVHRVAEDRVERVVVGARAALVAGEHEERLGRPVVARRVAVELDLGDGRARAADVARRRVHEEILTGAVEARHARLVGRGQEAVPREAVDLAGAHAPRVAHDDGDVVAGVGDEAVEEQAGTATASRSLARTVSSMRSDGLVCPPIEPTSALMTEIVILMASLLAFYFMSSVALSPCWLRAPCHPSCTPPRPRARSSCWTSGRELELDLLVEMQSLREHRRGFHEVVAFVPEATRSVHAGSTPRRPSVSITRFGCPKSLQRTPSTGSTARLAGHLASTSSEKLSGARSR